MKITLVIRLETGIEIPVSADIETFADVRKLGVKLAPLPANANKLIPGIAETKVTGMGIKKD